MIYAGIDVGEKGAIAVLVDSTPYPIHLFDGSEDTVVTQVCKLRDLRAYLDDELFVLLERQGCRQGQYR